MAYTAQAGLAIGHAHQKVTDLVRSIAFNRDLISQEAQQRRGTDAAFLSAAGHHHHIGLNTRRGGGGPRPDAGAPGLFHAAFLCPARAELARAVANALARGVALTGASGHGVSGAVHPGDPDGNGIELHRDRAPADWPRAADGAPAVTTVPFDRDARLAEA